MKQCVDQSELLLRLVGGATKLSVGSTLVLVKPNYVS